MNKLSVLLLALFFPLLSLADGWNEAEYRAIERSIESPKIANRLSLRNSVPRLLLLRPKIKRPSFVP